MYGASIGICAGRARAIALQDLLLRQSLGSDVFLQMMQLRESLIARTKGKPGGNVTEALQCVGVLASALHVSWQPYAQQLLDCMMHTGPSQVCQI